MPPAQLERSAFFTDYLVPWDSIYHLGVDLRDEGRYYARLRVSRAASRREFLSAAERSVVERLVPHFDNAIRTRAALDAARMGRAAYAEAMGPAHARHADPRRERPRGSTRTRLRASCSTRRTGSRCRATA